MITLNRMRPRLANSASLCAIFTYEKWLAMAPKREVSPHWLVLLVCLIGSVVLVLDPDTARKTSIPGIGLDHYQLLDVVEIQGVADNASGITYNPDSDTLFVVVNNPETLLELSPNGQVLRRIPLKGLQDTEGVVYLGHDTFAVLEERRRNIVLVEIDQDAGASGPRRIRSLALPANETGNQGFEGLTADPASGRLFVVNEKQPRQVWQVDGFVGDNQSLSITMPWDLDLKSWGSRDFSGLHFDSQRGTLLMLSDESRQLTESTLQGALLSRLKLNGGQAGLEESVPQAEGVTLDRHGTLYIVSEPNRLYRFRVKG